MSNTVFLSFVVAFVVLVVVEPPDVDARRGGYRRQPPRRYDYRRPLTRTPAQSFTCPVRNQTYLFAVGIGTNPYLYINGSGTLVGFVIDVMDAVCREARKTCYWSSLPWSVCSRTIDNAFAPGDYLMGGQVDACTMWATTRERQNSVDFTSPYYLATGSYFTIRAADFRTFNPTDFSGRTVVLINGWLTNEFCIRASGVDVTGTTFIVKTSVSEAIAALKNGEADIFFFPENIGESDFSLVSMVSAIHCAATTGMMVKRGSDIPAWWNPAFARVVASGVYANLCAAAQTKHAGNPRCLTF